MSEVCTDNRFKIIERAKNDILESTNISTSEDEMKVLDNFLFRCWQMGWLDKYSSIIAEWEGIPIGNCFNCLHVEEDFRESRKGQLNCPMWGAAKINSEGFCHMWKPKE